MHSIYKNIQAHPAWYGRISGLSADKMLRSKDLPFLFLLREGEYEKNYYLSFIRPNLTIRHHPFVITTTQEGWFYDDTERGGPYTNASIDRILGLMMHCREEDCVPLRKLKAP